MAEYTARAAEKLRHERQYCRLLTVFAQSSRYIDQPYSAHRSIDLYDYTADTRDLVAAALSLLPQIYQEGMAFAKAGVILQDFSCGQRQASLFNR